MLANISNIVNILTVFQLLILAFVIFNSKKHKQANYFLFSFLIVNTFLIIVSLLYSYGVMKYLSHPGFVYLFYSSFLLLGPLVFFYTKSISYSNFNFKKYHWIHFAGFFLIFAFFSADYFLRSTSSTNEESVHLLTQASYSIFSIIFLIQLLFYIIASFKTIHVYKTKLKIEFSSIENIDLSWLEFLLVVYFFHWFFDMLNYVFSIVDVESSTPYTIVGILSILTLLIFSTWVVIKGLKQSTVFSGIEQKEKYADSTLSKTESEMYVAELINYMETSRPYLEPSLKITELAESLSIPSKSLSQSINQQLGKNFYDFVNGYRIEEAKKQIEKTNGNGRTILEILYESGFNSKAAFNRAFKKQTGITPTDFKGSVQKKSNHHN